VILTGSKFERDLEARLEASDALVRLLLVGVIGAALFLLLQPSRSLRLAGALWMTLP